MNIVLHFLKITFFIYLFSTIATTSVKGEGATRKAATNSQATANKQPETAATEAAARFYSIFFLFLFIIN